ncbi:MAG: segregation and condensation protein B [Cryomorphaceae bacterium]|jgi:segregation and condensation protein B
MELTAIIEAILVASEQPLSSPELARLVRARVAEAEEALQVENEDALAVITKSKKSADSEALAKGSEVFQPVTLPVWLSELAPTSQNQVIKAIAELNQCYAKNGRSFSIIERSKGWKIYTNPDYADFVRQLFPGQKPQRLSGPAMETLAIIAYRQPITKAAMEAVRGVSCDGMLQKLLDRELICIGGRAELPGRPLLYETTELFFEYFGIKNVNDLPNASELRTVKLPEPEPEAPLETASETGDSGANSAPANEFENLGSGITKL